MTKTEIEIILGGLLHDIGKVVVRPEGDARTHSQSGYDFVKDAVGPGNAADHFLDCVRYHHAEALRGADLAEDAIAYITAMADRITAMIERRESSCEDTRFVPGTPLQSVFGHLNGNREACYYRPALPDSEEICFPQAEAVTVDAGFYTAVQERLTACLQSLTWDEQDINVLLDTFEELLSYVPSATPDISLYEHLKMTAAVSSCIYHYLKAQEKSSYREVLFTNGDAFLAEPAFMLYSLDISGIQKFIRKNSGKSVLRTMRARSFYLEIMMQHLCDELLTQAGVSRANLLYAEGGHCYMLLPNTAETMETAEAFLARVNRWLTEHFDIALYVASGYAPCSAYDLGNATDGACKAILRQVEDGIAQCKVHRYDAQAIRYLNRDSAEDPRNECKVCKHIGETEERGLCPMCASIEDFSGKILYDDFFIVSHVDDGESVLLPDGFYLSAVGDYEIEDTLSGLTGESVRVYGKNAWHNGRHIASRIRVADYTTGQSMASFAEDASGASRYAALRADADQLCDTFERGFENETDKEKYVSIVRTAILSKQLALFFKQHINHILQNPGNREWSYATGPRRASVIYCGGDDIFLVGAWDDMIGAALDLQQQLGRYTAGTITLSAGIGMYGKSQASRGMAAETSALRADAKRRPGKGALTLMPDGQYHTEQGIEISDGTYGWKEFQEQVLGEKYTLIEAVCDRWAEIGKGFLYKLLELVRNRKEKINFARCVYMLSKLEPGRNAPAEDKELYERFSGRIYEWIRSEEDSRQLKTAISIYVYMNRQTEGQV